MSVTTMRISKSTLKELESLKEKLGADTLDDIIQHLLKERRRKVRKSLFGKDAYRIPHFTGEDRGEDRR